MVNSYQSILKIKHLYLSVSKIIRKNQRTNEFSNPPGPIVHTLIEIKSIHNLTYNEVKIEYNLHIPMKVL